MKRSFYGAGPGAGGGWQKQTWRPGGVRKAAGYATRRAVGQTGFRGRGVAGFNAPTLNALRKNTGELKGLDTAVTNAGALVIGTTSTNVDIQPLNLVRPGNGSFNRVGRKIFLKSLRLQGFVQYSYLAEATTGDVEGSVFRGVLVWDKQSSGNAAPTYDEIFGVTDQAGTESTAVLDPPKYDNMARFQVLKDMTIACTPQAGPSGAGGTINANKQQFNVDCYVDLKNRTVVFGGDSSPQTIADISSGALYFCMRATRSTANTQSWSLALNSRLRYTDG